MANIQQQAIGNRQQATGKTNPMTSHPPRRAFHGTPGPSTASRDRSAGNRKDKTRESRARRAFHGAPHGMPGQAGQVGRPQERQNVQKTAC